MVILKIFINLDKAKKYTAIRGWRKENGRNFKLIFSLFRVEFNDTAYQF